MLDSQLLTCFKLNSKTTEVRGSIYMLRLYNFSLAILHFSNTIVFVVVHASWHGNQPQLGRALVP